MPEANTAERHRWGALGTEVGPWPKLSDRWNGYLSPLQKPLQITPEQNRRLSPRPTRPKGLDACFALLCAYAGTWRVKKCYLRYLSCYTMCAPSMVVPHD